MIYGTTLSLKQLEKAMSDRHDELLEDADDSQAVEADIDNVEFLPEPDADSGVVAVEPMIITIGRGKRKRVLRNMSEESS